ncbi:hypothetical protein [Rhodococcus sp. Q]|uniref:hypothetical protein n=1 Tax=Rhodococcus sp. Q TaxID=2502252 RepID=UPI001485AD47|nr:hypothetical protein [Rhodococcus sp. Q]
MRILHPLDTVGADVVRWRDVAAATGRVVHPLVQWWRLIDAREPFDPRSARWDGGEPEAGALDEPDAGVLVELLARRTSTPDVAYFALWEGSGHFNGSRVTYRGVGSLSDRSGGFAAVRRGLHQHVSHARPGAPDETVVRSPR